MITYLKYVKVYYEKRMITNCSPCSSCRRQDLECGCGEKLSNTRPVSQAADYLKVLHVMVSQEVTGAAETNPCGDEERCAWFSLKAGQQPRWSCVRSHPASCSARETTYRSELSIKESEHYDANDCHLSQDACQEGWSLQDKGWISQIHLAS